LKQLSESGRWSSVTIHRMFGCVSACAAAAAVAASKMVPSQFFIISPLMVGEILKQAGKKRYWINGQ
jgi:hypothetical protein